MADTKYEPCPFCGGTNVSLCERDHLHFVMCGNCTAEGPAMEGVGSEGHAVKEWNRRSTSSVSEGGMPELPRNYGRFNINGPNEHRIRGWSAEQMQEYARAAIAADRLARQDEPVAWMYIEDGEPYFGHPSGYRPDDAVPLYRAAMQKGAQ